MKLTRWALLTISVLWIAIISFSLFVVVLFYPDAVTNRTNEPEDIVGLATLTTLLISMLFVSTATVRVCINGKFAAKHAIYNAAIMLVMGIILGAELYHGSPDAVLLVICSIPYTLGLISFFHSQNSGQGS